MLLRRRRRTALVPALICGLALVGLQLQALPAQAISQSNQITYVYDDLGRLEAVVDPSATNGIAKYTYDNVGNLLSIARQSASVSTVLDLQPKLAKAGSSLTIYGAGFSSTASQDTVRFGGTQNCTGGTIATVTSATVTQLVVAVPSGGTGQIAVSAPSGCSRSTQTFTQDTSAPPTISSFSPTVATTGSTLTINGSCRRSFA